MKIKVRYAETDKMGVAYYANYFVWFEVGRTERLERAGIPYRVMEEEFGVILPVIEAFAKYRKSVRFDEEIEVIARIVDLSHIKLTFEYRIYNENGDLSCEGYTLHVPVNSKGKVIRFPEYIYEKLRLAHYEDSKT
ncbi:MAG: acyl-CoA thioesterase [Thermosulfidibacteraceae bacterium]|jgi:acyl-CoA thioester hydrolase